MQEKRSLEGKSVCKGVRKNYSRGNTGSREGHFFLFISDKGREIKSWLTCHLKILFLVCSLFWHIALPTMAHIFKNSGVLILPFSSLVNRVS